MRAPHNYEATSQEVQQSSQWMRQPHNLRIVRPPQNLDTTLKQGCSLITLSNEASLQLLNSLNCEFCQATSKHKACVTYLVTMSVTTVF